MYEGSGPDCSDRAESCADFASWASRQGNDIAGLEESLSVDPAVADADFRGGTVCNGRAVLHCADNVRCGPADVTGGLPCRHGGVRIPREAARAAPRKDCIIKTQDLCESRKRASQVEGYRGEKYVDTSGT